MSGVKRLIIVAILGAGACAAVMSQTYTKSGVPSGNPFSTKSRHATRSAGLDTKVFRAEFETAGTFLAGRRTPISGRAFRPAFNVMQTAEIRRLEKLNGEHVEITMDESLHTPIFIKGKHLGSGWTVSSTGPMGDPQAVGARFLKENGRLFMLGDPADEFVLVDTKTDDLGMTHLRYKQVYRGMEIWGCDAWVHLSRNGSVESYNGRTIPSPVSVNGQEVAISEEEAVGVARNTVRRVQTVKRLGRVIYINAGGNARVCWLINVRGGMDENMFVFIDAENGSIQRSYNHVFFDGPVTGSGTDLLGKTRTLHVYQSGVTFYMIDASKAMFNAAQSTLPQDGKGVIYTLDARNADSSLFFITSGAASTWSAPNAVSASANGAKVYDYYSTVLGRNAIDGNGSTMSLVVNFRSNFNNAFWNGQLMVFGTGDGNAFSDLAAAMDVTAHEMTHGVVERTANLVYENQSGALNESFADIFGVLAELWSDPSKTDWWMIGEDVTTPGTSGDALRRMDDPGAPNIAFNGQQPAHMSQYNNLPNTEQGDNGGVHVNSGIPNKAFYVFATSPGITMDDAAKVYYRALTTYLTRNSQFVDCRLAVIKAAEDLFGGPANAKATAAAAAFDAVGITSGAGTPPPPTQPPVSGTNYLAVIDASSFALFRTAADGASPVQLTAGSLWSRPTVTDDGSGILYVDQSTNLHYVQSDGSGDQALTASGGYNNVSISPNGQFLAVTTTLGEASVYVFDLVQGGSARMIPLYTPTYSQGVEAGTILFPDRIDWASDGQVLMYDALNQVVNATGDTLRYWDINLLRVADGAIGRLFPPQPPGVDIGNAVFASNTDNIIAFDYLQAGDSVRVLAVDLNTGTIGQVTNNWFSLGSPSFSSDDSRLYYHYINQNGAAIYVVSLAQDGITGIGNDQVLLNGGIFPVSFTVGTRPTGVAEGRRTVPRLFGLRQNYPNPFNPTTTLEYGLDDDGFVSITVYDLLGREVARLVELYQNQGTHRARFDARELPSGMYVVTLESGGKRSVRRLNLLR